jgi:hypothetical protein
MHTDSQGFGLSSATAKEVGFCRGFFTHVRVSSADETALRKTYNLCAQGAVPRSFNQRTSSLVIDAAVVVARTCRDDYR